MVYDETNGVAGWFAAMYEHSGDSGRFSPLPAMAFGKGECVGSGDPGVVDLDCISTLRFMHLVETNGHRRMIKQAMKEAIRTGTGICTA